MTNFEHSREAQSEYIYSIIILTLAVCLTFLFNIALYLKVFTATLTDIVVMHTLFVIMACSVLNLNYIYWKRMHTLEEEE